MKMKSLTITLDVHTIEALKTYEDAIGISIAEFIEDVVIEFVKFQQSEMDELYLNDDGTKWLIPRDWFFCYLSAFYSIKKEGENEWNQH